METNRKLKALHEEIKRKKLPETERSLFLWDVKCALVFAACFSALSKATFNYLLNNQT